MSYGVPNRSDFQQVEADVRAAVEPFGWTVTRDDTPAGGVAIRFENPLSPGIFSCGGGPFTNPEQFRRQVFEYIGREDEFGRMQIAPLPKRRRKLLGILRGAAGRNSWSRKTFEQVLDVLHEGRVISSEEARWLTAVGPSEEPKG
jgi:hypothetical protein